MPLATVGYGKNGRVDLEALDKAVDDETAGVLIQSPNFFGTIEDVAAIADIVHKKGALLVVSIAEAVSLGIVKPPAEADIVSMEAQSFGVPLGFGGPYCGVIATHEKFVRQMPGRLVGETVDRNGKRGFVLTLSTREQHIRREKATSNICTNQALVALMCNIFMTIYGKRGTERTGRAEPGEGPLRGRAVQEERRASCCSKARRASTSSSSRPTDDPHAINDTLLEQKIIGGFPLKKFYPELGNASLWCCTETTTRASIDAAAKEVARWNQRQDQESRPPTSARTKDSSSRSRHPARRLTSCRRSTCLKSTPKKLLGDATREDLGNMPEVSEIEIIRHFTRLSTWNYAVDHGMYPLGSCTMKYNARVNEVRRAPRWPRRSASLSAGDASRRARCAS